MKKAGWLIPFCVIVLIGIVAVAKVNPKINKGFLDSKFFKKSQDKIEGTLEIFHKDDFLNKKSENTYSVRTAEGKKMPLVFSKLSKKLIGGSKIKVASGDVQLVSQPVAPLRTVRLLVIRITLPQGITSPFTRENLQVAVFGDGPNSIKSYYERSSFGNIHIVGDVLESVVSAPDSSIAGMLGAADPIVDYRSYDHILFINLSTECAGYGFANLGNWHTDTMDGSLNLGIAHVAASCRNNTSQPQSFEKELLHEFGHSIGLQHAGALRTNDSACPAEIPISGAVSPSCLAEYNDITAMGGDLADLSAQERRVISFNTPIHSQAISQNGDYSLYPLSTAPGRSSDQYQELQIPATNGYYSLEYESTTPRNIGIRFVPSNIEDFITSNSSRLDTILPTARCCGAFLSIAPLNPTDPATYTSFNDHLRNISVELLEINEESARLHITVR